jgi:hypothetical protein
MSDYDLRSGTGGDGSRYQHQAIPQLSTAMSLQSLGSWPNDRQWGGRAAAWRHRTGWVNLLLRQGDSRPGPLLEQIPALRRWLRTSVLLLATSCGISF